MAGMRVAGTARGRQAIGTLMRPWEHEEEDASAASWRVVQGRTRSGLAGSKAQLRRWGHVIGLSPRASGRTKLRMAGERIRSSPRRTTNPGS